MPLCLYYSIADWNHPNYPNSGRHHELARPESGDQPDWDKYIKPLDVLPRRATLLNNGSPVECVVNMAPSDHLEQKAYLRLQRLPANAMTDTVLVVKLEFA